MTKKIMYSKCLICGNVRRKGDKNWQAANSINERKILLSHGYCDTCAEIEKKRLEAECREYIKEP